MRKGIDDPRFQYINQLFGKEDEQLERIHQELILDEKDGIQVSAYEGRLLQLLATMIQAKKVVEVGTLYGYSALWLARALPEDGQLFCIESKKENFDKAKRLLDLTEVRNKIEWVFGEANDKLNEIGSQGPFDMVFIDANKSGYADYLSWAEENVRQGGVIVGDNTFLFDEIFLPPEERQISPAQYKSMSRFNERLADPKRYKSVLLPTKEGLTVAFKLF